MSQFAGIAARIEAVIGPTLTAKLLAARGGTVIDIPKRIHGSALAALVGHEAAARLRDTDDPALGPGPLKLPMAEARGRGAARRAALAMLAAGTSLREVALIAGVDIRTAARWRRDLVPGDAASGARPSPGPLFDQLLADDDHW